MEALDPSGTWLGTLQLPSAKLRLVLNVERSGGGGWSATADSPDQGGFGIPVTRIDLVGSHLTLSIDSIGAAFSGDLSEDGRTLASAVPVAKGHPGNPMTWDDMRDKFNGLVEPRLGKQTAALFGLFHEFGGRRDALVEIRSILGSVRAARDA